MIQSMSILIQFNIQSNCCRKEVKYVTFQMSWEIMDMADKSTGSKFKFKKQTPGLAGSQSTIKSFFGESEVYLTLVDFIS